MLRAGRRDDTESKYLPAPPAGPTRSRVASPTSPCKTSSGVSLSSGAPNSAAAGAPPRAPPRMLARQSTGVILRNEIAQAQKKKAKSEDSDWRWRVLRVLEMPQSSRLATCFFVFVISAIGASVFSYFLSSVGNEIKVSTGMAITEMVCTGIFTVELLLRIIVGTVDPMNVIVKDIFIWVDALSIVPFYAQLGLRVSTGDPRARLPHYMDALQLFRLMRILKLLRHYSGWRVLLMALSRSGKAIFVPIFAMFLTVLLLSGVLYFCEAAGHPAIGASSGEEGGFENAFEAMWAVFWLVTTLGYDGDLGSGAAPGRLVIALALLVGLLLTTMPITMIGGAFASAWDKKEVVEVAMRVQQWLQDRALTPNDVKKVFKEFDTNGNGELDFDEFKRAMRVLSVSLPSVKMKQLFLLFDADESGTIDHSEFCRLLFPAIDWDAREQDQQSTSTGKASASPGPHGLRSPTGSLKNFGRRTRDGQVSSQVSPVSGDGKSCKSSQSSPTIGAKGGSLAPPSPVCCLGAPKACASSSMGSSRPRLSPRSSASISPQPALQPLQSTGQGVSSHLGEPLSIMERMERDTENLAATMMQKQQRGKLARAGGVAATDADSSSADALAPAEHVGAPPPPPPLSIMERMERDTEMLAATAVQKQQRGKLARKAVSEGPTKTEEEMLAALDAEERRIEQEAPKAKETAKMIRSTRQWQQATKRLSSGPMTPAELKRVADKEKFMASVMAVAASEAARIKVAKSENSNKGLSDRIVCIENDVASVKADVARILVLLQSASHAGGGPFTASVADPAMAAHAAGDSARGVNGALPKTHANRGAVEGSCAPAACSRSSSPAVTSPKPRRSSVVRFSGPEAGGETTTDAEKVGAEAVGEK